MSEFAVVDDMIGDRAFAMNLIAYPSDQSKATLREIQDLIGRCIPVDSAYRCPEYSLHMSVFQYVHSRKSDSFLQVPIWDKHYEKIIEQLQSITRKSEACTLELPSIHVSESAVTIQFACSHGIELLRDHLEAKVSQSELAWNRPTIQHVTIYRYLSVFELNQLKSKINEIDFPDMSWRIESLDLVRENIYPSLDNKLVQRFTLRA